MREVLWVKGYAATSLDDLCAAAGMNRPSLYNAFGDKAQVFKAVLDTYVADVRPRYEAAFRAEGSLRDVLRGVYDTALSIYETADVRGLGCFMIGAALTDSVRDPQVAEAVLAQVHLMDKGFLWLMKKAQAEGALRPDADVPALAMMASSVHSMISVRMRAGEPLAALNAYIDMMTKVIAG
ncbi:MAG: TetR/AcrR family transcriptional regulator [Asticcacaulis sp.]